LSPSTRARALPKGSGGAAARATRSLLPSSGVGKRQVEQRAGASDLQCLRAAWAGGRTSSVSESNLHPRRSYGADPGTLLFAGALPFAGRSNTGGARSSKSRDGFSKAHRRSATTAGARVSGQGGEPYLPIFIPKLGAVLHLPGSAHVARSTGVCKDHRTASSNVFVLSERAPANRRGAERSAANPGATGAP